MARLIVMVKDPRPGRVKTRLARDIGPVAAAWWYRHNTSALLRRLADPRWQIALAVSPDTAVGMRVWPGARQRLPQGRGDLGQRMARLLRQAPPGPVCLIGSDIPGLAPRHIARAFAALGSADAVFGPALDGGFWLVGLCHPRAAPAALFADVRWSSEHALGDSLVAFRGRRVAFVEQLRDVDCAADLPMTSPRRRASPSP